MCLSGEQTRERMTAGEVARVLGAELSGSSDAEIRAVKGIADAGPGCLTFLANRKYLAEAVASAAAAVIVDRFYDELSEKVQLKVANPHFAFARVLELFHGKPTPPKGVMTGAVIEHGVTVGSDVTVYPGAYVSEGSVLGDGTTLYPGVFIGEACALGKECVLHPNVTVRERCTIGERVVIHSSSVIGADGFGYVFEGGRHYKIPQVGTVTIGDDVEIGAGVTIDRATTGATVVGEGTKIDNLVQIGHNVTIGRHCIIVAQVGIAGSTVLGDYVTLGGQVGVADHTVIESGTMVAAKAGIMGTVKKGAYSGAPAFPHRQWLRAQAIYEKLPDLVKEIRNMEQKIKELEERNT